MLDAKVNVAVSTDGANCPDGLNICEAGSRPSPPLTTGEAFKAATEGSARAQGIDYQTGKIAKGYQANIVLLDLHHVNWIPTNDVVNQVVHIEDGNAVRSVMIGALCPGLAEAPPHMHRYGASHHSH